ncbi:MAG: glycerophosphodiester phosphodiesterase, partial [Chloroflexota bacterium]
LAACTGKVQVVGHRGAMGHAPENTMASFTQGLALGADAIELDVQLSRDGALVVIHDATVDRTTSGTGLVKDLSLQELRQLDAGSWFGPQFAGERIPTLGEVLDWARGRTRLIVEIKNGPVYYPGIAERVVACLREHNMLSDAMVISFDHPVVREVKDLEPALRTGVLYVGRVADPVALAARSGADVLMPLAAYVTQDLINLAHAAGLRVSTWTVDQPEEMRRLMTLGVDGIGTNYPDRLRALL